jgi:hypothetical protein
MGKDHLIVKSTSFLLIGVMAYMHICSALCAMASGGNCCIKSDKEDIQKTCCSHDEGSKNKDKSCQDYHLSFFKISGQYSSEKSIEVPDIIPTIAAVPSADHGSRFVNAGQFHIAFNRHHPPLPITDIRIFIQSFQI